MRARAETLLSLHSSHSPPSFSSTPAPDPPPPSPLPFVVFLNSSSSTGAKPSKPKYLHRYGGHGSDTPAWAYNPKIGTPSWKISPKQDKAETPAQVRELLCACVDVC
eukprot:1538810-Rhodomonas_salina.2